MTRIVKKIKINKPKKHVWDIVSDLGGIQNYNPGVRKSYYITDEKHEIGAGRVCEFQPMGKVEEVATKWDNGNSYTLEITPIEKLPFFKKGYADFKLSSDSNGETWVEVSFSYTNSGGIVGKMMNELVLKKNFHKGFEGILSGLKKHAEDGDIIDNFATLKGYSVDFA